MRSGWLVAVLACSSSTKPPGASGDHATPVSGGATATHESPVDAAVAGAPDATRVELAVVQAFGGIDLVESVNSASFMHGGAPAQLARVSVKFEVRDARAHRIDVTSAALVTGCRRGDAEREPLTIVGLRLHSFDGIEPIARGGTSIVIPPRGPQRYTVAVEIEPVTATDRACTYDVAIVVDRVPHRAALPLRIKRIEPIR